MDDDLTIRAIQMAALAGAYRVMIRSRPETRGGFLKLAEARSNDARRALEQMVGEPHSIPQYSRGSGKQVTSAPSSPNTKTA